MWENVTERNREMIVKRSEWNEAERISCVKEIEIQLCDSS